MSYEYLLKPKRNPLLLPPNVRGLKILDRQKFCKSLKVGKLLCPTQLMPIVFPKLKHYVLKIKNLKPIGEPENVPESIVALSMYNPIWTKMREIILNPLKIESWHDLPVPFLEKLNIKPDHLIFEDIELTYDNWYAADILESVLPYRATPIKPIMSIGHIVHVNLNKYLLPYKNIIGEVLLDNVKTCRTVVNKSSLFTNAYQDLNFELICGEPIYEIETKSSRLRYKLDYSQTYWDPKMSTEHRRFTELIDFHDLLYDVSAGIGPCAVPAARKGCTVISNDGNAYAVAWLKHNLQMNAKDTDVLCYNMEANLFIREIIKEDLIHRWHIQSPLISLGYNMYIVIRLAHDNMKFLSVFRGLFLKEVDEINFDLPQFKYPYIFCYTTVNGPITNAARVIAVNLNHILCMSTKNILKEVRFLYKVTHKTNMYLIVLRPNKILFTTNATTTMRTVIGPKGEIIYKFGLFPSNSDEIESDIESQVTSEVEGEPQLNEIQNNNTEATKLGKRSKLLPTDDSTINDGVGVAKKPKHSKKCKKKKN